MTRMTPGSRRINVDNLPRTANVADLEAAYRAAASAYDFSIRGIKFNTSSADPTSAYATIRGVLVGDGENDWDDHVLARGIVHPLVFRKVDYGSTTAVGIMVVGGNN